MLWHEQFCSSDFWPWLAAILDFEIFNIIEE